MLISPALLSFAGLAMFSQKRDKDPWTDEVPKDGSDRPIGILCARLEGGTVTYMSPQQKWVISEARKINKATDKELYLTLKDLWQITPATSDFFQAGLTCLEMHARAARWFGPGCIKPHEAVKECTSRTSTDVVSAMSPAEAERWAVEDIGVGELKGKIESNEITGAVLLDVAKMGFKQAKKAIKGVSPKAIARLSLIRRGVSTHADAMHEDVAALLTKILAVDVSERPAKAREVLEMLGVHEHDGYEYSDDEYSDDDSVDVEDNDVVMGWDTSDAVGGTTLPSTATAAAIDHPDETVATTLGGLAKALVLHGNVPGALSACAEWWGVASDRARNDAASAYGNVWKRHGKDHLRFLDLSRAARGHWCKEMLSGEGTIRRLAENLAHSGVPIEMIDLSEQPLLEGPVLELFDISGFSWSTLITLKIKGCGKASGSIPPSIRECAKLQTLELQNCGFSGVYWGEIVEPMRIYLPFVLTFFRRITQRACQPRKFDRA